MTSKTEQTPLTPKRDPDLVNAEIALKRAAKKAREEARRIGVSVVVLEDGEIKEDDTI